MRLRLFLESLTLSFFFEVQVILGKILEKKILVTINDVFGSNFL